MSHLGPNGRLIGKVLSPEWNESGLMLKVNVKHILETRDALAEWLRRVPAKYVGFPRERSNLSGVKFFKFLSQAKWLAAPRDLNLGTPWLPHQTQFQLPKG